MPLWLAAIIVAALFQRYGVEGLTILGLTPLLPLNIRSAYLWLSILAVGGFSLAVFGILYGIRRILPSLRNLPLCDVLLAGWLPGVGLVLTLWRMVFAYGDADWLARLEPVLVSVGTVLALTGAGAVIQRLIGFHSPPPQPSPARGEGDDHANTPSIRGEGDESSNTPYDWGEGDNLGGYLIRTNLLGAVGLSVLLYLLALVGLWYPGVLWLMVALAIIVGVPLVWRDLGRLEQAPDSLIDNRGNMDSRLRGNDDFQRISENSSSPFSSSSFPRRRESTVLYSALFLILSASTLLATLPPDDSDELRYHLTIPKRYLEHHGWVDIEGQQFSHFPLGMEMLFALPLSLDWMRPAEARLSLVGGGKIIHLWFFMLCLMVLRQWDRERLVRDLSGSEISSAGDSPPWGLWLLATVSFIPVLASWAFVDFGSAFGWLSSAYFVWKQLTPIDSREERWVGNGDSWIFYASVAVGWAMMVKYTGLAWWVILGMTGGTLLCVARRLNVKMLLAYALIPPLLMSPWLLHNWLTTGNPFSPLLSTWFGDGFAPVQKAFYDWHAGMKGHLNWFWTHSLSGKLFSLFLLPLLATLAPEEFENNPLGGLLLCLLPLGLLGGVRLRRDASPRGVVLIAVLAMGIFLLWALTYRDPRFAIPLWAILAMGIGLGIEKELRFFSQMGSVWASRLGVAFTVVLVLWGLGQCDEAFLRCLRFSGAILLRHSPDAYLTRPDRLPVVATIREVENLRARQGEDKPPLLLLGQEQSFYFDSPVCGNDYFDGPELAPLAREATSVEAISSQILAMGYKWIWVNHGTLEGNTFNLFRGDLFTADQKAALVELSRIRDRVQSGLSEGELEKLRTSVSANAAFRRMQAWLVRHPGFHEVPLNSVREADRPICPYYGDWLKWEEMRGVTVKDLPRRNISLLIAE